MNKTTEDAIALATDDRTRVPKVIFNRTAA